ncbi:MAG: class I adenylate-forming enzyme family protein, partial [Vicinamibacteria bacterium]
LDPTGPADEDEIAHLYYTSGTTGNPKGVMLTHRNVVSNAKHQLAEKPWHEGDVWLHAAPLFHLADAWATFVIPWRLGLQVCVPVFEPKSVLEAIAKERVTQTILVPTMINALVNEPTVSSYDLSSVRFMMYGASPMPVELLRKAIPALGCEFYQGYGLTETSPLLTALHPEDHVLEGPSERVRRLASCGREITGVRVRVVREDGKEVAPGEVGEIVASGPNIMKGYWRNPDATREAIVEGWFHTGDLATRDEDNYIFIVDRKKDMIISGGENIYSTEVENVLYAHPGVLDAAVIGIPDEKWGERVLAVIVLREGAQATAEELIGFCQSKIAGYKIPRQVEFRRELPKTGSGKIAKREIRDPFWKDRDRKV